MAFSGDGHAAAQAPQAAQGIGRSVEKGTAFVGGQLGRVSSAIPATQPSSAPQRLAFQPMVLNGRITPALRNRKVKWSEAKCGGRSKRMGVAVQAGNPQDEAQPVEAEVVTDTFDPLGLAGGASTEDMDSIMFQKQLWEAAKTGDVEGIAAAVSKGAIVDFAYVDEGEAKAIQCAALNGNTAAVEKLVELGADVNGCDKYKWTALHDAALNGHAETCAKLVALGAVVNAKTDVEDDAPGAGERTPLNNAAMNGHTDTVLKLVSLGASIEEKQKDGWSALHLAAKNGWDETVATLVDLGIDVNVKNDVDMTPLHYAAWDATPETCKKLIELGADVGHKAKGKLSALELAEKRRKEKAGRTIVAVLKGSQEKETEEEPEAEPPIDAAWSSKPDDEWRKLKENDPFKQSITGGNI